MKKLPGLMTVVASLAFFSSHLMAEKVTNIKEDISLNVFVPCANDGAGEVVALGGSLHTLVTTTTNENGSSFKVLNHPQGISGTGLTTGDQYRGTGGTQTAERVSFENGHSTQTFINNFRIIGRGPGNNLLLHTVAHVTVNANGDVTVDHQFDRVECR